MNFAAKRDRIFTDYKSGLLGSGSVRIRFVEVLLEAPDDTIALALCESLPDWFREEFRSYLLECADGGYERRWFSMGDPRTGVKVKLDAKRHGDFLERLTPSILAVI